MLFECLAMPSCVVENSWKGVYVTMSFCSSTVRKVLVVYWRSESGIAVTYPVGAFGSDCFLCKLIAKADLEFGAVQALFAVQTRNVEFPLLFGDLVFGKSLACKDESKLVQRLQLLFELSVGVYGENRRIN